MKRILLVSFLIVALMLPSTALAAGAADDKTLVYAAYADVKDWDPSIAFSMEVVMLRQVYETLTVYNPPGSKELLSPGLATSWEVSEDGLTWTFKLRQGVKFHDGEPFNAAAVKYCIDRTKKLKKGASFIWAAVKEVKVVDDYTVRFIVSGPTPIDVIASAQYGAYIYSPKAGEAGTEWFMKGRAAGTGPYMVDKWDKSQQVVLKMNPGYWGGRQGAHFERAIIKVVTEKSTQIQMIKSGEADFASLVPVDALAGLKKNKDIEILTPASWKNSQFLINTKKAPTDNLKIRRAILHAWDWDAVVNGIYNGLAKVATGPVPGSMWGHDKGWVNPEFNLDKAKKLVAESGVPADKLKITIQYIGASQEYSNCAQLLQANLAKIGITAELAPGPWGTIWDKAKKLETAPNLQSMTWWPTYPTPNDWLIGLFKTEKKTLFNLSHYSNPAYDALIDKGVKLECVDKAKAAEAYSAAQQILLKDAVAICYADIAARVVKRASVKGYVYNPAYAASFHQLSR